MLERIMDKIEKNIMFDVEYLQNINADEVLDLRDTSIFDAEWIKIYEELLNISITEQASVDIDKIREVSFKKIYEITENGDLAAYISDDFELMCKAYVSGYENAWLASLANAYENRKIPYGKLECIENNFKYTFNQLANLN